LLRIERKTGKLIEEISFKPGEREVLFKSGTKFEVIEIGPRLDPSTPFDPNGITTIWLKEI
jgi:hypothetical protein